MEKKILCGCHNVTLDDVKAQIELGVRKFKELQDITNIGTDCPPCTEQNEKIFNDLLLNTGN